jgi:hypothetical protein
MLVVPMLSDQEILDLIKEEKVLPQNFRESLKLKNKSDLAFRECDIVAESKSHKFVVTVRVNIVDAFDFSIILSYIDENGKHYIIRRYNGKHYHKNKIEKTDLDGYHIHTGTERYQKLFKKIDGYAEPTNLYDNWNDALALMIFDCNFKGENTFIVVPVASLITST